MHTQILKLKGRAIFLAATLALSGTATAQGLLEVKQTVFGMDCSPCAHGVEKGLEKLKGVKDATVSLNEGYAAVVLDAENSVTLEKIQKVVRENGFTPKDATVVIAGTIERGKGDQLVLTTSADHAYALDAATDKRALLQDLQALPAGSPVEIEAHLAEGDTWKLSVLVIRPEA